MLLLRRRPRRRTPPLILVLALALALALCYIRLPPSSPVVLALRFNGSRAAQHALALARPLSPSSSDPDAWLRRAPKHPLHIPSEVGCLIKTGYGTRHRVRAQIEALTAQGGLLGDEGRDYLVVGDWGYREEEEAAGAGSKTRGPGQPSSAGAPSLGVRQIHDAVAAVLASDAGRASPGHPRFAKHRSLRAAIAAGDEHAAEALGRQHGWELDALKFIAGMDMAFRRMPHKKWYMILDDDTFVVRSSLAALLARLDPDRPYYLGNAVGDYRARFAHGGSAVLLSGEAMRRLFAPAPAARQHARDVLAGAYARSLDETWGDRLVATTLQGVGVYLSERHGRYFNGEEPRLTRVRPERACATIVSFHGLRRRGAMRHLAGRLAAWRGGDGNKEGGHEHDGHRDDGPLLWGHLWGLFAARPLDDYAAAAGAPLPGDLVGPADEATTSNGVDTPDECRLVCRRGGCLAWSFDPDKRRCRTSPWVVPGGDERTADRGVVSGVNRGPAEGLSRTCPA